MDDEKAVEIMARAIHKAFASGGGMWERDWDKLLEIARQSNLRQARTALAAIRAQGREVVWWLPNKAENYASISPETATVYHPWLTDAYGASHFAILRGPEVKP